MKSGETLLEMARRHVQQGECHVLQQRDLVQRLEDTQSSLTDEARALLVNFEAVLRDHKKHLAQIEEEMQSGRRDANGDVLPAPI
jgi:hypothetical protein